MLRKLTPNLKHTTGKTFAEWGVDYLKLDGCNNVAPDKCATCDPPAACQSYSLPEPKSYK